MQFQTCCQSLSCFMVLARCLTMVNGVRISFGGASNEGHDVHQPRGCCKPEPRWYNAMQGDIQLAVDQNPSSPRYIPLDHLQKSKFDRF